MGMENGELGLREGKDSTTNFKLTQTFWMKKLWIILEDEGGHEVGGVGACIGVLTAGGEGDNLRGYEGFKAAENFGGGPAGVDDTFGPLAALLADADVEGGNTEGRHLDNTAGTVADDTLREGDGGEIAAHAEEGTRTVRLSYRSANFFSSTTRGRDPHRCWDM